MCDRRLIGRAGKADTANLANLDRNIVERVVGTESEERWTLQPRVEFQVAGDSTGCVEGKTADVAAREVAVEQIALELGGEGARSVVRSSDDRGADRVRVGVDRLAHGGGVDGAALCEGGL